MFFFRIHFLRYFALTFVPCLKERFRTSFSFFRAIVIIIVVVVVVVIVDVGFRVFPFGLVSQLLPLASVFEDAV